MIPHSWSACSMAISKTPSFPYLAHRYLTSRMSAIGNRNDCFAEFHCATLSCLIEASYLQRQRGEKSKALSVWLIARRAC